MLPPKGTGLAQLLAHPAIWRGRSAARSATLSTGFRALDDALPGGGWPQAGLTEILVPRCGVGELRLLLPLLARAGAALPARWTAWIAPPFEPYAPALAAHGVQVERQLVVRTELPLWAMEQALDSGACALVLAWTRRAQPRRLRRLQLAAGRGRTPGFLFRAPGGAREASPAELRLLCEPGEGGMTLRLLKSRGGARAPVGIRWSELDGAA